MKRTFIFYVSEREPRAQARCTVNRIELPDGGHAWVRVERARAERGDDALDEARLQPGEVGLMNTHTLEV